MSDISVLIEHSIFAIAQSQHKLDAQVSALHVRRILFPEIYSRRAIATQDAQIQNALVCAVETGFISYDGAKPQITSPESANQKYARFAKNATFHLTKKGADFAPLMSAEDLKISELRAAYK